MSKEALNILEIIRKSDILPSDKGKDTRKEEIIYVKKDTNREITLSMSDISSISRITK